MGLFESLIPASWSTAVQQAEPANFWLAFGVFVVLSAAGFYLLFRSLERARLIEDMPTSKVRSAAQGYVELDGSGRLMPGQPIVAPLSGLTCTWYRIKVEELVEDFDSRGGRRRRWKTIRDETSSELFLLVDETGECVVDPDGADVTPSISDRWYEGDSSWSSGIKQRRRGLFASGRYRCTEHRMHMDDPLYALGQFRTVGGYEETPDTRREVSELLAEWKRNQASLLARFDTNGDGQISVEEWEQARKAAWAQVRAGQRERAGGRTYNLLTRPDEHHRPYLLSALPQEQITRRYRWFVAGGFAGFLLAGAVAVWMVTVRMLV